MTAKDSVWRQHSTWNPHGREALKNHLRSSKESLEEPSKMPSAAPSSTFVLDNGGGILKVFQKHKFFSDILTDIGYSKVVKRFQLQAGFSTQPEPRTMPNCIMKAKSEKR